MILRFCLYSVFKNLRFADPFFVLYLLALGRNYTEIGFLLGYQHLLTVLTEVPSGYLADRWGRCKSLVGCFLAYFACYSLLAIGAGLPSDVQLAGLYLAMTCFGFGEAMRTGSHKAIMLDWLDSTGQSNRATEVIGLTRSYSKYSAGVSAVCGGIVLFATQRFELLFWLSALPAAAGIVLMWTYPRYLDGECSRAMPGEISPVQSWKAGLRAVFSQPRTLRLLIQSVLFESQIKVVLKYYAQPVLTSGLARLGIQLVAGPGASILDRSGAVWIGIFELCRESLGGLSARYARSLERYAGGAASALAFCYAIAAVVGIFVVGTAFLWSDWLVVATGYFVLLTVLQNVRRPVFVSALNVEMEKSMRATILSLESVARSICLAITLPVLGLLADAHGLQIALLLPPLILATGWALTMRSPFDRNGPGSQSDAPLTAGPAATGR